MRRRSRPPRAVRAGRPGRSGGHRGRRDRASTGAKAPPDPRSGDPRRERLRADRGRRPRAADRANATSRSSRCRCGLSPSSTRCPTTIRRSSAAASTPATRSRSTPGSASAGCPGRACRRCSPAAAAPPRSTASSPITHWLWFFEPYAVLSWILVRHPDRFPRAARQMAAVFDAGAFGYWAMPTAPPWWAAEQGLTKEPMRRIMFEVGEPLWGDALGPALRGARRQPLGGDALAPLRHLGAGRDLALRSEHGGGRGRLGLRADPRLRARLPRRALRHRPARRAPGWSARCAAPTPSSPPRSGRSTR